jgi:hypothetical protein
MVIIVVWVDAGDLLILMTIDNTNRTVPTVLIPKCNGNGSQVIEVKEKLPRIFLKSGVRIECYYS